MGIVDEQRFLISIIEAQNRAYNVDISAIELQPTVVEGKGDPFGGFEDLTDLEPAEAGE